eukprot:TRINITY_DN19797_c0_g1_i2.p1 TRINITY_DN19797_c0_g1~~TRINITY_DN19797_c0_g1_i2.p1  ORF type:complete len:482 (-),score=53.98 TRINITY_DN19797_c0_g1_i2:14-1459(-)
MARPRSRARDTCIIGICLATFLALLYSFWPSVSSSLNAGNITDSSHVVLNLAPEPKPWIRTACGNDQSCYRQLPPETTWEEERETKFTFIWPLPRHFVHAQEQPPQPVPESANPASGQSVESIAREKEGTEASRRRLQFMEIRSRPFEKHEWGNRQESETLKHFVQPLKSRMRMFERYAREQMQVLGNRFWLVETIQSCFQSFKDGCSLFAHTFPFILSTESQTTWLPDGPESVLKAREEKNNNVWEGARRALGRTSGDPAKAISLDEVMLQNAGGLVDRLGGLRSLKEVAPDESMSGQGGEGGGANPEGGAVAGGGKEGGGEGEGTAVKGEARAFDAAADAKASAVSGGHWLANLFPVATSVVVVSPHLQVSASGAGRKSPFLRKAWLRYQAMLFTHSEHLGSLNETDVEVAGLSTIRILAVTVESKDENLALGVDETYTLQIPAQGSTMKLKAKTVFGALRGLETLAQGKDSVWRVAGP